MYPGLEADQVQEFDLQVENTIDVDPQLFVLSATGYIHQGWGLEPRRYNFIT